MDQKFTSAGTALSGALMLFCAFITLPLGLGFLFSYPDPVWWLGLLFLGSAVAFIMNGITNIKLSKRLAKDAEEDLKKVSGKFQQPLHSSPGIKTVEAQVLETNKELPQKTQAPEINDTIVLVTWQYTPEEWRRFRKWEVHERKLNSTIEASLIIIIGTIFISGDAGWLLAFGISAFVAAIYWAGKYFLSMASIGQPKGKLSEVVITQYAVIINGKHNAFNSQMYWKGAVTIKEEQSPKVLEITYHWNTRKGSSHDEIRVPIPEGKLDEAKWLTSVL